MRIVENEYHDQVMAGWLDNSFGHLANRHDNAKVGSISCKANQLQPAVMSTVVQVLNPTESALGLAVESTSGRTVKISAQNKPQQYQDQSKQINKTNATLPPAAYHSIQPADKTTANNQVSCPPNDSCPLNTDAQNKVLFPAVKKNPRANKFTKNRFRTPRNWEITQICNLGSILKKDAWVSVFAVVRYFFPPKVSGGTDMYFHFGLVDQTLYKNEDSLKCMCFQEFEQDMPLITSVGDIIKFPLRITTYRDNLQGRTFDDRFPWMTFDGRPGTPIVPRYSRCAAPTFTDADKKKVEELRSWAESIGLVKPNSITLAELTENLYFDLFCQVVHIDNEKNVLYVWDGTELSFEGLSSNSFELFASATKWGNKVVGKLVKVTVYGCDLGCTCNVGQYILIPSLHFTLKHGNASDKECQHDTRIPVFTLDEKVLWRRKIKVLDEGDNDVKMLEQRMEMLPTPKRHSSQEVPVINKQPTGRNVESSIPKVTQAFKRKRVSKSPVVAAVTLVTSAQATIEVDTGNEATVHPCNQETTIRAAIGSTSLVSGSNQAKKTRVHGSSSSDHAIVSPIDGKIGTPSGGICHEVRITQAMERPLGKSCVSNQIIVKPTAHTEGMPPAYVSSHRRNTNEKAPIRPAGVFQKVNTKQVVTPPEPSRTASKHTVQLQNPSTDSLNPTYTIREMRNKTIVTKFRCHARVVYAMPDKPERFVKYVCKLCRQRYEQDNFNNGADTPDFSAVVKCINTNCSASLSPTIQFSVILKDDTGLLDVSVTDMVARKFLPYVEPLKLLTDEETQRAVKRFLETLISKQDYMEFDIKRFNLPNGKTIHSLANWKFISGENS